MAIAQPKKFGLGLVMLIGFFIVIVLLFMPIFGSGRNAFNVLDGLYNSVSKSSSDFNREVEEKAAGFNGQQTSFTAKAQSSSTDKLAGAPSRGNMSKPEDMANQMVKQVEMAGGTATAAEKDNKWTVKVSGDLGAILGASIEDAKLMYENNGDAVAKKYGYDGENVLNNWWNMFNSPQADLNDKGGEAFEQSKMLKETNEKSIEPAYNYYRIDAESPSAKAIPILLSLGGYVLYTVWYGFALLFMFEGWGLKLEH